MSRVTCCLQCWQEPPHNKWTRLLAIFCPVRCSPRLANTSNQHPAVITITKYFLCVRNIFFVLRLNIFQSGWRGTAPSNDTFAGLYAGFWSGLNNNKQLAGGGYDCAGIISCSYGGRMIVWLDCCLATGSMPIENVGNVRLLSITADSTLDCGVPSGGAGMKVNPSVSVLHYTSADYRRKPPELWRWVSGGVTCNGDITLLMFPLSPLLSC